MKYPLWLLMVFAGILLVGVLDGIYSANPLMASIRGAGLAIAALIIWKEVRDRKKESATH